MAEQLHLVSDDDGYRPNVGIVLFNSTGQVLWPDGVVTMAAVPQGGIEQGETVEQAAYRELYEEVGTPTERGTDGSDAKRLRYDVPAVCGRAVRPLRGKSRCGS